MNFLVGLLSGQADDPTHSVIARYGRGVFQGPAAEANVSGSKLKVSGSFLYVPVLGQLLADRCAAEVAVQGVVVSKVDIVPQLEGHGFEVIDVKKRGGFKYTVQANLSGSQLHRLYDDLWEPAVLLKSRGSGFSLTTSQSVPKPNDYSDPAFCSLTMPASDENQIAAFRSVVPGVEAARFGTLSVKHIIKINDILVSKDLAGKPASMVRLMAKRKGVLTRQLTVDGRSVETQHEFVA